MSQKPDDRAGGAAQGELRRNLVLCLPLSSYEGGVSRLPGEFSPDSQPWRDGLCQFEAWNWRAVYRNAARRVSGRCCSKGKTGGDRFYSFYTRDELSGYFAPFTIERERRDLLKERDGAMEFWLRKERPSGQPFGRQRPGGSAAR